MPCIVPRPQPLPLLLESAASKLADPTASLALAIAGCRRTFDIFMESYLLSRSLNREDHLLCFIILTRRLQEDNPLKYWERRDAVEINKARIGTAQGGGHVAVPAFVGYGFEPAQGSPLDPSAVIAALEGSGRSWATKDPRLSLTASEWLPHLTTDRTRPPPVRPLV